MLCLKTREMETCDTNYLFGFGIFMRFALELEIVESQ